jgi:DNA-directed RNA polymerase specialized sigma24 family protein
LPAALALGAHRRNATPPPRNVWGDGNLTGTMTSDAGLLAAARSDPDAFRELYRRYAERIHSYFARRTHDPHAAHDLTAETFAQAWMVRTRFRDEADGSAAPWLFGIARNVLLMSVRRGRLERRTGTRSDPSGRPGTTTPRIGRAPSNRHGYRWISPAVIMPPIE